MTAFPRLTPLEWLMLVAAIASAILTETTEARYFFPSQGAWSFAVLHYLGPLVPALLIPIGITYLLRLRARNRRELPNGFLILRLRSALSFAVIVYLHFNFKLWAQLIHPVLYDDIFHSTDLALMPLIDAISLLDEFLFHQVFFWPAAYHDVFVAMFLTSFTCHAWIGPSAVLDRCLFAVCFVLVVGGLAYVIAPAWGPFTFGGGINPFATEVQKHMADFQGEFNRSQGASYLPANFINALGAMPSLHVAHAYVFVWLALKHLRPLGLIYLLPFAFIVSEALAAGWHYVVDLIAGLLIAGLALRLASHFYPSHT